MYQVGLCFQAGFVTSWVKESVEIGTCDIAMNSASSRGMSAAKSATKCVWSIHQSPLLSGLKALDACGRACSIDAQLSPSSRAKAAIYRGVGQFFPRPLSGYQARAKRHGSPSGRD